MKAKVLALVALGVAGLGYLAEELAQHAGFLAGEGMANGWRNAQIEKRYQDVADGLNRKTPVDAGNGIRLDTVDASNMTVTYHYTVLQMPPDVSEAGAAVKGQAKTKYCADTTTFKGDGVALAMKYVDTSGNPVFDFRISPDDC